MFDIISVEVMNFRSFRGEHKFDLPTEPGLYNITGWNELKKTRIGSGKSSFFIEAVNWCLFGKTSRGLKAMDVITWGEDTCSVRVAVRTKKGTVVVERTQNPNGLYIHAEQTSKVEQSAVDDLIGLNQEAFGFSIMMPQFGDSFFDLKPAEKLTLFTQILSLDYWLDRSKAAEAAATDNNKLLANLTTRLTRSEDRYNQLGTDIASLASLSETHKIKQKKSLVEMASKLKNLKAAFVAMRKRSREIIIEMTAVSKEVVQTRQELKSIDTVARGLIKNVADAEADEASKSEAYNALMAVEATCPTCLQKVDKDQMLKKRRELLGASMKAGEKLKELTATLERTEQSTTGMETFLSGAERRLQGLELELASLPKDSELTEAILELEDQTREVKADRSNPYLSMLEEKTKALDETEADMRDMSDDIKELTVTIETAEFWAGPKGFKAVRLFEVASALSALEMAVNNNLAALGYQDWSIEFDVERENKSGGITKGFTTAIHSPDSGVLVPWAGWSGGETHLLRLSGALGLSDLITTRAGLTPKVEFFDEPSRNVTEVEVTALAEILRERAHREGKRIFLIDHQAIDSGLFDGIITVVKDKNGSHLEA